MKLFETINIIYESDDVLVISKPTDLVVTPGPGYEEEETLVGWLIDRYGDGFRDVCVERHRPGVVHRLDKETSGVMVVAKTLPAFHHLIAQFKTRTVRKQYLAVCWGDIRKSNRKRETSDSVGKSEIGSRYRFEINAPIGRNPKNRMRFAVMRNGKPALTRFTHLKTTQIAESIVSSVLCYPKTGRTHQIRVHLKALGYGIVGDRLYQNRKKGLVARDLIRKNLLTRRMYLHSYKLSITLPGQSSKQTFTAPIPLAFKPFLSM